MKNGVCINLYTSHQGGILEYCGISATDKVLLTKYY
jgi:hypothetical protein